MTTEKVLLGSTLNPVSRMCWAIDEVELRSLLTRCVLDWSHFGQCPFILTPSIVDLPVYKVTGIGKSQVVTFFWTLCAPDRIFQDSISYDSLSTAVAMWKSRSANVCGRGMYDEITIRPAHSIGEKGKHIGSGVVSQVVYTVTLGGPIDVHKCQDSRSMVS